MTMVETVDYFVPQERDSNKQTLLEIQLQSGGLQRAKQNIILGYEVPGPGTATTTRTVKARCL